MVAADLVKGEVVVEEVEEDSEEAVVVIEVEEGNYYISYFLT